MEDENVNAQQHEHRWFVQDEDEPANAYLVCIQCGEVVDPPTFLAMREIVQEMAHRPLSYNPMLVPPRFQCNHCDASTGALEVVDGRIYQVTSDMAALRIQHTPECPVTKARAIMAKSERNEGQPR